MFFFRHQVGNVASNGECIIERQPLCLAVWPARHPPDISTEHRSNARVDPFLNPGVALQATLSTHHRMKQHIVMTHKNWWKGAQWGISTCLCKHTDIPVELSQLCYIALWLESGLEFKTPCHQNVSLAVVLHLSFSRHLCAQFSHSFLNMAVEFHVSVLKRLAGEQICEYLSSLSCRQRPTD